MYQIKVTNALTGAQSSLTVNDSLSVGDTFRLIGRAVTFRVTNVRYVLGHQVVGGVCLNNKYATVARTCDTAQA